MSDKQSGGGDNKAGSSGILARLFGRAKPATSPGTGSGIAPPDRAGATRIATPRVGHPPAASAPDQLAEDGVPIVWHRGITLLDLYDVTAELGRGGMGVVHKVRHKGWSTDLAVKSPLPQTYQAEGWREAFEHECEAWINLGLHPHTVSCYYVRQLGGIPRIFAEYIDGGNLRDWIEKPAGNDDGTPRLYAGGPDEALRRILDIAIQMAWGLQHAHDSGLVHQDVKPANVMMTADGLAKVTDFGLAQARQAAGETRSMSVGDGGAAGKGATLLVPGAGMMTPEYCSPEQHAGKPLSPKTDMWSWGVSVLHMFAGRLFWPSDAPSGTLADSILTQLLSGGARRQGVPPMPARVVELLRRCFREKPDDRPANMVAVADALIAVCGGESYDRKGPQTTDAQAASLNNRAVSMLDLGKAEMAERLLEQALWAEPHQLEATYNIGLIRWRSARITDTALLRDLRESACSATDTARAVLLQARVMLEADDCVGALAMLQVLEGASADHQDARTTIAEAERRLPESSRFLRAFEGHRGSVNSACLSSDGRIALSGSSDNTVKVWDVASGNCLRTFMGNAGSVNSVFLSADGRFALSGNWDKTMKLWEVATGQCLRSLRGHTEMVWSVGLTADGCFGLSGSGDKTLRLREIGTGKCLRTFDGHAGSVLSVCIGEGGRLALSASSDDTLKLWDVETGKCIRTFEGHRSGVNSVCLSADGRFALSGSSDGTLKLWEIASGACLRTFEGHEGSVNSVHLSADGRRALSGSYDNTLKLWDVTTGRCLRSFNGHTEWVKSVCLSADGRFAVSGGNDNTLRYWFIANVGNAIPASPELCLPTSGARAAAAASAFREALTAGSEAFAHGRPVHARRLLSAARRQPGFRRHPAALDEYARLYSRLRRSHLAAAWETRALEGHRGSVSSVCLSKDDRFALSGGSYDKTLKLWEVATGKCLRTFEGHTECVQSVCLSSDSRLALSGSDDKSLKLWDVATGVCIRTFEGHTEKVNSVCLSGDTRFAVSASGTMDDPSSDDTLKLWDVATGACLRTFGGHAGCVCSVCLNSDGRFALSGSFDFTLKLWDVTTGKCLRTFEGHALTVAAVCLSGDGRFALSGSDDNTLKLWDIATGQCLRTFEGHTDYVHSVCLCAVGRFALSASWDDTLKLWDLKTGNCLRTFEGHTDAVSSVCLSADGQFAISGSWDDTLKLWHLDWDLEDNEPSDWHEGARPYLATFLTQQTPYAATLPADRAPTDAEIARALTRAGKPAWTDADFDRLLYTLGCAGYGWLRPEGVRRELDAMAAAWQGPPPLPGQ